jgi:hypothetical protein
MGIRNWVKTLLAFTPLSHLQLQRKIGASFLKCIFDLNNYPWRKKNAQTQSLLPQIWGLKTCSRKCFHSHPIRNLAPPPVSICVWEKLVRGILRFFFKGCFQLQYLPIIKKHQRQSFLFQIWMSKNSKKNSQHLGGCHDPYLLFCPPKKNGQCFLQIFFAVDF